MASLLKTCSKCYEVKELSEFRIVKRKRNNGIGYWEYHRGDCLECERKQQRKLRQSPEYKKKEKASARKSMRKNPEKAIWKRAKRRAISNSIPFSITIEDIIIPDKCPILQIKLSINEGVAKDNSPSLDKIDPNKGYVKGNIQVISRLANIMKAHATKEQLKLFSKNIIKYINYEFSTKK